jgi:hypothetical protein
MRNYNEVLDWLLEADRKLPVADWRIGDLDLWPLVRAQIAVALQDDVARNEAESQARVNIETPAAVRLREAQALARLRRNGAWRGLLDLEEMNGRAKGPPLGMETIETLNANRLPAEIFEGGGTARWLLFGNANLSQEIGGQATHRLFDPIVAEAANRGVESVILISSPLSPGDRLARVQHHGIADSLYELRRRAHKSSEPVVVPELDAFVATAPSPSVQALLQRQPLEAAGRNLAEYAAGIGELIDACGVTAIFTIPYASLLGTALCAAGRKRGVPVLDVQHGLIGAPNPYYQLGVANGFNTLPSHIWLWDDEGVAKPQMGGAGASFVGGNPYYALVGAERRSRPEWAISKEGGRNDVLVTLSNAAVPLWLPGLIGEAPASWRWWVRLHPAAFNRAGGVADGAELLAPFSNVELERASRLPLPILIEIADIHVTEGSSSALEARAAGLATLFYTRVGYEYFRGLPGGDRDRLCEPERLVAAIGAIFQGAPAGRRHDALTVHSERLRQGVSEVLSLGEGTKPRAAGMG